MYGEIMQWLPGVLQFSGGVVVGAFVAGRVVGKATAESAANFQSIQENMDALQNSLTSHLRGHEALCERQKEQIVANLRKEIGESVKAAVAEMTIDHNRELASMDKSIALLAQCAKATKASLDALADRFDRRNAPSGMHQSGYDYGKRHDDGGL